jgi:hypothetical protein
VADGTVQISTDGAGKLLDNSLLGTGTPVYRQRVVIGGDASSGSLAVVGSTAPSAGTMALYTRLTESSGTVIGLVAPSSQWTVSGGAGSTIVSLSTTQNIVNLSSAISNYVTLGASTAAVGGLTSGTAQIGSLGPSSGTYIGVVVSATSGVVNLSTTSVVGLTTTSQVALTSGNLVLGTLSTATVGYIRLFTSTQFVGLVSSGTQTIGTVVASSGLGASTAAIGSLTSGTAQIGSLGPSSAIVIGTVAQSSNWNLSTAAVVGLSSGTAQVGSLGPSSAVVIGLVAPSSQWTVTGGAGSTTVTIDSLTSGALDLISGTTGNKYLPIRLTDGSTFYTAGGGGAGSTLVSLSTTQNIVSLSSAITNYVTNNASTEKIGSLSSGTAQIGSLGPSSGTYIGVVVSATSGVVNLSTTSVVGLTTTSLVGLSSAISNYITNSTTVPVYLGQSSGNVIGLVAPSSQWTITGGAGSTLVSLSTTQNIVNLSSALSNYVTNSTTVPVYLGQSSGNVIGLVAPSSQWTITGGAGSTLVSLSSGAAYVGTVVSASSGLVYFSTTTSVGLFASTALVGNIGGIVAVAGFPTAVSSGNQVAPMMDKFGRQVIIEAGPPDLIGSTFSSVTANTCMTQLVGAAGAGLLRDLLGITINSSAGTTTLAKTTVMLFSSSGQAEPGVWAWQVLLGPTQPSVIHIWDRSLPGLTANNPWFIVSTSSAAAVRAFAHYVTRST